MTQDLDSSALLAVLLGEPSADRVRDLLAVDPDWLTARHSYVELRRRLARPVAQDEVDAARADFSRDRERTTVVELDADTCSLAADLAEKTGARALDALHLAACQRAAATDIVVLTLDVRLTDAARTLGMRTRGIDDPPRLPGSAPVEPEPGPDRPHPAAR